MMKARWFDRLFKSSNNPAPEKAPVPRAELPSRVFANRMDLKQVVVPATVRRIGFRAFENCKNLNSVTFCEGVEALADSVFAGCGQLHAIRLPASLTQITGRAFADSGLREPVLSADGRVLVYAPLPEEEPSYTVPEGVEEIGPYAFDGLPGPKTIHLPQSLKRIRKRAFYECGQWTVSIPKGVEVEDGAFADPKHRYRIQWAEKQTPLKEQLTLCRARGEHFLVLRSFALPREAYWKQQDFIHLASLCAQGHVEAMEQMAAYFANQARQAEQPVFFQVAEQFWQVRAFRYGSKQAEAWLEGWMQQNPGSRMTAPLLEDLTGVTMGETLNALGFLFFQPDREYALSGVDEQGIVSVSSYESEDGPDEDGFGREIYYDWWYLDEFLNLPEGLGFIHSYSRLDKRTNEAKFDALYQQAAALVRSQRGKD